MEWSIEWRDIYLSDIRSCFEVEKDYIYSLILGSFHPNGYFREHCIKDLSRYQDTLPYIILRMNDWVGNIRKCATDLIMNKILACSINELFLATLALNKVRCSERREANDLIKIHKIFSKRIEEEIQNISLSEICNYEFDIRKNIYRMLFSKKILEIEKAEFLLSKEKHSFCKSVIISGILEFYECSMEYIDVYLKNKNSDVRRKALEFKYSILKDSWIGLEGMLLDENSGVREIVTFILRKHSNINVLQFYIEHLKDKCLSIAIIGIGKNGEKELSSLLIPFLDHNEDKIVKLTVLALGNLMGYDGYDLYWKFLMDIRPGVSKAAYLSIRNNLIHYGAEKLFGEYKTNSLHHIKRYLALLIMLENSWERLPYLLYLYDDVDLSELHDKIRLKIINRDMYGKITQQQMDFINKVMNEREDVFPKKLIENIRFDLMCIMR
jgi:hypothetical protein